LCIHRSINLDLGGLSRKSQLFKLCQFFGKTFILSIVIQAVQILRSTLDTNRLIYTCE